MSKKGDGETTVFVVRTTIGQEAGVAALIEVQAKAKKILLKAILVPENVRGYLFIEAPEHRLVEQAVSGLAHVRGGTIGRISEKELDGFLVPKKITEGLSIGDIVEITGGPFKGEKARVGKVDIEKEEVVLELLETPYNPIPVKVKADYVRVIERVQPSAKSAEEEEEEEEKEKFE
ncbi:MAG: transcription elongation factor Spt5 [Candidatus Atabeyarchaeum deiterrae]